MTTPSDQNPFGQTQPEQAPYGQPGAPVPPPYGYGYPEAPQKTSAIAIVALCLFWLPVVGLVLGIIGIVKTGAGKAKGRAVAIVAVVLSALTLAGSVLIGVAIGSKTSALDPGCVDGKAAILDLGQKIKDDQAKGDTASIQTDVQKLIDQLNKAAGEAHRDDVKAVMTSLAGDYQGLLSGDTSKLTQLETDANQVDHLCTIGAK